MSKLLSYVLLIFLICSCGSENSNDDDFEQRNEEQGHYRTNLKSINPRITGYIHGYAVVWANERQFYARVSLKHSLREKKHYQFIHSLSRCPDKSADYNKNGVIEFDEVLKYSGGVLIPLDQNLRTRKDGFEWFPSSNKAGSYVYARANSFRSLMLDLRSKKRKTRAYFTHLPDHEELSLNSRTIIMYALDRGKKVPVACGELDIDPYPEIH